MGICVLLVILQIIIGTNYITQDNFKVIEGIITIAANSNVVVDQNYPENFTEDNCYPIACGIKAVEYAGYNYEGVWQNSASFAKNAFNRTLNFTKDKIQLTIYNSLSNETNFKYKIILNRCR